MLSNIISVLIFIFSAQLSSVSCLCAVDFLCDRCGHVTSCHVCVRQVKGMWDVDCVSVLLSSIDTQEIYSMFIVVHLGYMHSICDMLLTVILNKSNHSSFSL